MTSDNIDKNLHVSHASIANIPPFTERVDMTFNPAINIFIGSNSSGKTTILKLLKSKGVGRIASHTNAGLDPMFSWLNIDSKRNSFEAYIADSSGGTEKQMQLLSCL